MDPILQANMDFIGANSAEGAFAQRILTQGRLDPNAMRPWIGDDGRTYITVFKGGDPKALASYSNVPINYTGTLRRDEWKQLDDAVLAVSRQRLGGFDDLAANNLVFNLGNAMGTTVLEYHDISDAMVADLTMDGVHRGQGDRPVYGVNYLPLPIVHVDFEINTRVLEASRRMGIPLDTTSVELATRKVQEKLEDMLFTDTSYGFGGGTIYSYLNAPKRNTKTDTEVWDDSASGADIVVDVREMKAQSIADHHFGPWMLYIPTEYESRMDDDYVSGYPKTIRQRIMEIEGIKGIKTIDRLTDGTVLLVQMTSDVVRNVRGLGIQVVEWQTEGKFITKYKVITIQVPQIRNDQEGHSGIVHMSLT